MPEWRIDSLDARGGLAFASWWDDVSFASGKNPELYCFFVGAPDFRPEPVANRAIALAAGRGAFQTGLFVENVEVPFPTPAAVVEFVRRVYLRSGGGDGAEGGGGVGPTPRPIEGPDLGLLTELVDEISEGEGRQLRAEILKAIQDFHGRAPSVPLKQPEKFHWPASGEAVGGSGGTKEAVDGPAMLASAALRLIYEMARRLPSASRPAALGRWQSDARILGSLLSALDLWPLLLSKHYCPFLERLAVDLVHANYHLAALDVLKAWLPRQESGKPPPTWLTTAAIYLLFIDGPLLDDRDQAEQFFREFESYRFQYGIPYGITSSYPGTDPVSDLLRMPLPEGLESFVGSNLKDGTSLYHALTAFTGSPATILTHKGEFRALIDLVLFASACMLGPEGSRSPTRRWLWSRSSDAISPTRRIGIQKRAEDAWGWLAEHLPTLLFSENLEKAIENAASLRYASIAQS